MTTLKELAESLSTTIHTLINFEPDLLAYAPDDMKREAIRDVEVSAEMEQAIREAWASTSASTPSGKTAADISKYRIVKPDEDTTGYSDDLEGARECWGRYVVEHTESFLAVFDTLDEAKVDVIARCGGAELNWHRVEDGRGIPGWDAVYENDEN